MARRGPVMSDATCDTAGLDVIFFIMEAIITTKALTKPIPQLVCYFHAK